MSEFAKFTLELGLVKPAISLQSWEFGPFHAYVEATGQHVTMSESRCSLSPSERDTVSFLSETYPATLVNSEAHVWGLPSYSDMSLNIIFCREPRVVEFSLSPNSICDTDCTIHPMLSSGFMLAPKHA